MFAKEQEKKEDYLSRLKRELGVTQEKNNRLKDPSLHQLVGSILSNTKRT